MSNKSDYINKLHYMPFNDLKDRFLWGVFRCLLYYNIIDTLGY